MSFSQELLEQLQIGPGDVVVIATKRGGGKTYLATRIAGELADIPRLVTFFSQDLSEFAVRRRWKDMGITDSANCRIATQPIYGSDGLVPAVHAVKDRRGPSSFMILDSIDYLDVVRKLPLWERHKLAGHALAMDALAEKRTWIVTATTQSSDGSSLMEVADVWLQPNWGTHCFEVIKIKHGNRGTIPMPKDWPAKNLKFPGS